MQIERILIVHRKSLFQLYVTEHREKAVKLALDRGDRAALRLRRSHEANDRALARIKLQLHRRGIEVVARWRAHVRSTRNFDLVISLGGDGTLLDVSHRILDDTPVLAINSDPGRSVGALCAGTAGELPGLLDALERDALRPRRINRVRVRVDGEPVLGPVLNDLLIAHVCPAGLTRYDLAVVSARRAPRAHSGQRGARFVHHRGSGIWIATATGSTAAIRSSGGKAMPPGSRRLQYRVREPYVAPGDTPPELLAGFVPEGQALVLVSRLRRGMIWADGVHHNVPLTYGQQVVVDNHPAPLRLVRPVRR